MFRANKTNQEVKESLQLTVAELNYLRKEYQKPPIKRKWVIST